MDMQVGQKGYVSWWIIRWSESWREFDEVEEALDLLVGVGGSHVGDLQTGSHGAEDS